MYKPNHFKSLLIFFTIFSKSLKSPNLKVTISFPISKHSSIPFMYGKIIKPPLPVVIQTDGNKS